MTHIQQRRDTSASWTATNPVLFAGEAGHESDTGKWKLGDGVTAWADLAYKSGVDSVAGRTGEVELSIDDVDGAAPLVSPAFTGSPTAVTPALSDNDTSIATTAFVKGQGYAPLASPALTGNPTAPTPALADDDTSIATSGFVKDVIEALLVSPVFTGNPTAPTPLTADNDTSIATTAFVKAVVAALGIGTFQNFAPAIGSGAGAYANASPSNGRYIQIGKLVYFTVQINIITAGTATGSVTFQLPTPAAAGIRAFWGRENATGPQLQAINSGGSTVTVLTYNNASPIGDGRVLIVSGLYEAA